MKKVQRFMFAQSRTLVCKEFSLIFILRGGVYSNCSEGYTGRMCNKCGVGKDGSLYGRSGGATC